MLLAGAWGSTISLASLWLCIDRKSRLSYHGSPFLGGEWLCFFRLGLSVSTGRFGAGCKLEVTLKRNAQRPPLYAATLVRRARAARVPHAWGTRVPVTATAELLP